MEIKEIPNNCTDSDFLELAKVFSDNFKKLSIGEYVSDSGKYKIRYCEHPTLARVGQTTGTIEINKERAKEYSLKGL